MREYLKFYIGGAWVDPVGNQTLDVMNPATEQKAGVIAMGTAEDVDRAVCAAREAFEGYSTTTRQERVALLESVTAAYERRIDDFAHAITEEMGAPAALAIHGQAAAGVGHLRAALNVLKSYSFEELRGSTMMAKEPIGVCALITPWNWPINQIACKVAPALAVGCTMVLKPSEVAPFSAQIWAEVLHDAGVPAGVFNLVNGDGATVGTALSSHPLVDMVSFTGSTRAGIEVARNAAPTVKRVAQELGGKSPNILLEDADFEAAVAGGISELMMNSGQTCCAPTRMLVPRDKMDVVKELARKVTDAITVGAPDSGADIGPVASDAQWSKIQSLIKAGIDEGATLVTGGPGRPDGLETGFYVRPTIFADVTNDMTIAREEIFGPVLAIIAYDDEEDAVRIANDTVYGLSAYVQGEHEHAIAVGRRLRAGQIFINGAPNDYMSAFGGYKQSGNGREWGEHAFSEFLEVKSVLGFAPASQQAA